MFCGSSWTSENVDSDKSTLINFVQLSRQLKKMVDEMERDFEKLERQLTNWHLDWQLDHWQLEETIDKGKTRTSY